ncbi:thioredoxin family protein [Candidatus Pyrohabitans sp.]
MKYLPVILIIIISAACVKTQTELPFNYNEEDFDIALKGGSPVILEIGASWCRACIEQQPIIEELKKEHENVKFFLANYDTEKELVKRYGVRGVPYFIFFDSGGREVMRITGFQEKDTLEKFVFRMLYKNYTINGTYSTFGALKEPKIHLDKDAVVVETEAVDNFTVWGEGAEVLINNMTLRIINISPDIYGIRDFETMNITAGTPIRVEAKLPANITAYEALNVELKMGIWDEGCCGNYREVILGAALAEEPAQ